MALLDREFYSAQVFQDLTRKRISFVMSCRNESYVKQALKEFKQGKRKMVSKHIIVSNTIEEKFVIIIISRSSYKNTDDLAEEKEAHSKYITFATNLPIEYVENHAQELVK